MRNDNRELSGRRKGLINRFHFKRSVAPITLFIVLAVLAGCSDVKIPPSQQDGEWEIGVRSLERKGAEWSSPGGQRVTAYPNHEIVVVTASFSARGKGTPGEELVVPPIVLTDDAGKTYSGQDEHHLLRGPAADKPSEIQIPVGVAKGARLATLRIRGLTFKLQ